MDVMEEPQLWGTNGGDVAAAGVTVHLHQESHWSITLIVHFETKERPAYLTMAGDATHSMSRCFGSTLPLMNRVGNMSARHARRTLWALHNSWGKQGLQVSLTGAGKPS